VTSEHGGVVPRELDELLALPGIGPYTARAILVFAHEADVGVVDTNVGRLLARWSSRSLRAAEAQVMADALVPEGSSWSWTQSLFDLGATVCRKRAPDCARCPVTPWCAWAGDDTVADPATGSAGVSGGQAPFEGSDRQARGRLMGALGAGPVDRCEVARVMGFADDRQRADRLVGALVKEGLVRPDGRSLLLGG
jgi:A/G-specific adenine glycosylase